MLLIDAVRSALNRLAKRGWKELLALHGLDITATDLAMELSRTLENGGKSTIDRNQPGFEDFSNAGTRAIQPGNPALSLLYHALASPNVHPSSSAETDDDYPFLVELDAIENYIYSLGNRKISDFKGAIVAVFAYQYRTGSNSVHRMHADMAYSRTGISRVGTAPMHYDGHRRSFWAVPQSGASGICVMPARYAAFLCMPQKLSDGISVVAPLDGVITGDKKRTFLVPVHKLFAGGECLDGENIQLSFMEYHRGEKLRKLNQLRPNLGGVLPIPGFNINQTPFLRVSSELVRLQPAGASVLLVSNPRNALAETATQFNTVSGKNEIVRFQVPPLRPFGTRTNRFRDFSSLEVPQAEKGFPAPEYAHIRLHVRPNGDVFDVNTLDTKSYQKVLKDAEFKSVPGVEDGPLMAAHFVDNTCDGAIAVQVSLSKPLVTYAAASFVAAPDFLPLSSQLDVQQWAESRNLTGNVYFASGGPEPLCYGRDVFPNPALLDPISHSAAAFNRKDAVNKTISALVSGPSSETREPWVLTPTFASTFLPDGAANVFEPGWDTSAFGDDDGFFHTNYGLGSPFPEDAKLCAALNSFWPAAAPDVGRTFGGMTALPLLDEELGLHPNHPKVLAGQATSAVGWDGEHGPFFMNKDRDVNFTWLERSDYTLTASRGGIGLGLLGGIHSVKLLARMDAFGECAKRIRDGKPMTEFRTVLVTAEEVSDWSARERFDNSFTGPGYLYVFADLGKIKEDPTDRKRRIAPVIKMFTCQITSESIGIQVMVPGQTNPNPPDIRPREKLSP